jgi:serine/threonine-protein kinase HipA
VYLGDEHVAEVVTPRSGKMTLAYRPEVVERVGDGALVLSAALPARTERYSPTEVASYLEGLLPDGWARAGLERRFDVHRVDSFSLLAAIGRECAGAVALVPAGDPWPVGPGDLAPLDDQGVAARLARLETDPFGVDDDTRLTLAGSPWKIALTRPLEGGWAAPLAGASSTHLLRPEPPELAGLVAAEAFALETLRRAGLRVVDAEATAIAGRPVLVVARYDRQLAPDGSIARIHQEDCCQALGALRSERAERDGGPRLSEVAELVRDMSAEPEADLVHLLAWLIAAAVFGKVDGSARDLALLYPPLEDGVVECRLAPIASMAGTVDYPDRPRQLAMAVDGVDDFDRVGGAHLVAEAVSWGMPHSVATDVVDDLLEQLEAAVDGAREVSDPGDDVVTACRARLAALSDPG